MLLMRDVNNGFEGCRKKDVYLFATWFHYISLSHKYAEGTHNLFSEPFGSK